jgi:isopentenyl phosphate kinase
METIILKIGGSVITQKDENMLQAKEDMIRKIAREIKKAREKKGFRLVLIHGAGPFGHKLVTDYGIKDGLDVSRGIEGFVRTHNSMEDLNKTVMDIFREEGLLGFPVQPSACIVQENKKIVEFNTRAIEHLLDMDKDIIPIMYGDMVADRKLKGSVVSGDAITACLARKLKASSVLMGTDVDGIFSEDPKTNPKAELIGRIDSSNFADVLRKVGGAKTVDVTGGMKRKLEEIKENLSGIRTVIFNACRAGNTETALLGKDVGTVIRI